MGTLRIHGTIDLMQFWPIGESDADTTKIKLEVSANSFEYRKEGATNFKKTNVFTGAKSKGQVVAEVIKTSKKTGVKTITVRLQGVDAPELHYKGSPLKKGNEITATMRKNYNSNNKERRQNLAETSTFRLAKHLKQFANTNGFIKAVYESEVEKPSDAIDTYGRFVGDINIDTHNVNLWLVENGWGHPAFYTSMSKEEINSFLTVWKKGKKKAGRTGKLLSKNANEFDWDLLYQPPKKGEIIPFHSGDDTGDVLMPKIFRRQVSWMVSKKAKVVSGSTGFKTYLKKKPDQLVLLDDFLTNTLNSATVLSLDKFVSDDNIILKNPEELVFKEKPGILVNAQGKQITSW